MAFSAADQSRPKATLIGLHFIAFLQASEIQYFVNFD
jgi:hypothetical protein